MSGHSHFHNIKLKKGAEDAKRSKLFSKLSKEISVAVKDGGTDVAFNPKLRSIVDKAKGLNMPNDSIDKAIKRGSGELEGATFEEFLMEAYGPDNMAILIEGITDNMNRTFNEMRVNIAQNGGKLVESGALKWMIEKKGLIEIKKGEKDDEEMELDFISAGADDISIEDDTFIVETKLEDFDKVRKGIEGMGYKISNFSLPWIAKEKVEADKEKNYKLFEALDESEDVKDFYYNLND